MAAYSTLTQETLLQLLRYEPETGKLFWKRRGLEWFEGGTYPAERRMKSWNSRCAENEAFTTKSKDGYHHGRLLGYAVRAHRVIWMMVYGYWPIQVDHLEGCGSNNRLEKMREATQAVNTRNAAKRRDNKSGVTGVSWCADRKKWRAMLASKFLGDFVRFETAVEVRQQALENTDFSKTHGVRVH